MKKKKTENCFCNVDLLKLVDWSRDFFHAYCCHHTYLLHKAGVLFDEFGKEGSNSYKLGFKIPNIDMLQPILGDDLPNHH